MFPEKSLLMRNRNLVCAFIGPIYGVLFGRKSILRQLSIFALHGGTFHEMIHPAG